jgi:hypothetical protein
MSSRRLPARLAAVLALVAGVVLTVVVYAAPAYAADAVKVSLAAPDSATPGRNASVRVGLQNDTKDEIFPIRTVFTIRMGGLDPNAVQMTQGGFPLQRSGGAGEVRFVTSLPIRLAPDGDRGDSSSTSYALRFDESVQGDRAEMVAEAFQGETRLGGDSERIEIKAGRGDRPAATTPPNTDPGLIPTFEAPPTFDIAPLDDASPLDGIDTSFPWIIYVMGAILLGTGGVLLWLLFRQRGKEALADGPAGQPVVSTRTFPTVRPFPDPGRHTVHQPTTVLPTVRHAPGGGPAGGQRLDPPSDPWATQDRPIDRTRAFDPFEDPRNRR